MSLQRGMMRSNVRLRQRGMAVVGALVVVAAVSVVAAGMVQQQAMLSQLVAGERDRAQAQWLLRGGLDWARVMLINDARRNSLTLTNGVWSQAIVGFEVPLPDGTRVAQVSGQIEDEQGKFNVNTLAMEGQIQADAVSVLNRLFSMLGVAPELVMGLAQRVAGAQQAQLTSRGPIGLRTLRDLEGVDGFSAQTIARIKDYITILPGRTPVNVNTVSAELLSAVLPALGLAAARRLVQARNEGQWFNSRGDFLNRTQMKAGNLAVAIGVRSEWFKVSGVVSLGESLTTMQALMHRARQSPPVIVWTEH
ncbi:MAG TPA: general secretion pathway protein GspK [Pusillimonas sp.]|nr:general secretion pathway protein GspK [Pusillimonas sp.]|tara:strand:+ start:23521 stop:24441 length:921 start_codon:yes stop_codon:yes gene_type:complete